MKDLIFKKMKVALLVSIAIVAMSCRSAEPKKDAPAGMIITEAPQRVDGQKDVLQLAVDPIKNVRVGFIGLGNRGVGAIHRFTFLEGASVVALCDIREKGVKESQAILEKAGKPKAAEYSGNSEVWKELCDRDDIDLVYICTDWDTHVPMALYAMSKGKHVAIEVPATTSLKECWELVDMAEKTRLHCMMLENCAYDFFEMATLNMAQKGLFGEIVHTEGAYIHDLRALNFDTTQGKKGGYYDMWRLKHNEINDGNPYPTHGLGPVAQILNIHRGDKMNYLVSMSSLQAGMTAYAKENFGENSPYNKDYAKGDMNVTMIKTQKGKTIMIQHDVTSPRPYNRLHTISGTKGFAQKYPIRQIALEPDGHRRMSDEKLEEFLKEYEHPITREVGELAKKVGGHGGMDFIMDYRLIYCLNNGLPLDMDVYDAAEWSSIAELSKLSVNSNSMPIEVPDFTRGAWDKVKGFSHAMVK